MPIYAPVIAIKAGHIASFLATTAPDGYVVANGGLLSRAAYPNLWLFAKSSGLLVATDADWAAGLYSPGDGTTTFRIPELRGEFLRFADSGRGVDSGRSVGTWQSDKTVIPQDNGYTNPDTPFNAPGYLASPQNGAEGHSVVYRVMGDDRIVTGKDIRPRNVALLPCIKT